MSVKNDIILASQNVGAKMHEHKELEKQLRTKAAELQADLDNDELTEEVDMISAKVKAAKIEVEKAEKNLSRLQKIEEALGNQAVDAANSPTPGAAPAVVRGGLKKVGNDDPLDLMFKQAAIEFLSRQTNRPAEMILEERFRDDEALKAVMGYGGPTWGFGMRKSQVDPAMTNVAGWAAELVRESTAALVERATENFVTGALASRANMVPFNGSHSVVIPMDVPDTMPVNEPAFVAEGAPIPVTQFNVDSKVVDVQKVAAIVTTTNELLQYSTIDLVAWFRRRLLRRYEMKMDQALLSSDAARAGTRPAGLLNGVTPLTGVAGGGIDAVAGDMTALYGQILAVNPEASPIFLVNKLDALSAQAMRSDLGTVEWPNALAGQIGGYTAIVSGHVPQHTLVCVDASQLYITMDTPQFMISQEATIMENSANTTAPTMVADKTSGVAGTAAGEVGPDEGVYVQGTDLTGAAAAGSRGRSLFQTFSTGLRMVCPVAFAMGYAGSVSMANTTTWSK